MKIKFLRVLSIRAKDPGVMAVADDHLVRWNARRGWSCDCLTDLDDIECDHIFEVRHMIDEKVTTPLKVSVR